MTIANTPVWQALTTHRASLDGFHLKNAFQDDPNRAATYTATACGLTVDYSKNLITDETWSLLTQLANQCNLVEKCQAMFSGQKINTSEDRAVLHTALRDFSRQPIIVDGKNIAEDVQAVQEKMKQFVSQVHDGTWLGYQGQPIKDVLSIGIGGSFLGPKIMSEALLPYRENKVKVHYVANVDAHHIRDVLAKLDPATTLVIMSSKSFTTQETLNNTLIAKQWLLDDGATQSDVAKHFVCVSSNVAAASEFGIAPENIFPMWDWVGGRYSLWSAIGLPIALDLGYEGYEALLRGAYDMDRHFQEAPISQNLPMILALLGVWYINFFDAESHVLLPYYHYLRGLPAYVQQLDMESNGKQATLDNAYVDYATGPVIWGGEGTNGQHAFHQLMHQSQRIIPADFILPLVADHQYSEQHAMLAANCFAQTQALMVGKTEEEAKVELQDKGFTEATLAALSVQKFMPGNKPSNTILFDKLTPYQLGTIIALYEHKVFCQGVIWGINSFDQWGVELGKVLGNQILPHLGKEVSQADFDASTNQLIQRFLTANRT